MEVLDRLTQFCSSNHIVTVGIVVAIVIGLIMAGLILIIILQTPRGDLEKKNTEADG